VVCRKEIVTADAAGRAIHVLSVVEAYTRECLTLEVDTSIASRCVTRVLDGIIVQCGPPALPGGI